MRVLKDITWISLDRRQPSEYALKLGAFGNAEPGSREWSLRPLEERGLVFTLRALIPRACRLWRRRNGLRRPDMARRPSLWAGLTVWRIKGCFYGIAIRAIGDRFAGPRPMLPFRSPARLSGSLWARCLRFPGSPDACRVAASHCGAEGSATSANAASIKRHSFQISV